MVLSGGGNDVDDGVRDDVRTIAVDVVGCVGHDLIAGPGDEGGDLALHLLPDGFVEFGQLGWDVFEG